MPPARAPNETGVAKVYKYMYTKKAAWQDGRTEEDGFLY